jgi:ATP-dependent protease ClpP protease subunit
MYKFNINKISNKASMITNSKYMINKRKRAEDSDDEEDEEKQFPINPLFFESKKDEYIYKLDNHIYITTTIDVKSINKLSKLIYNMNKELEIVGTTINHMVEIKPKPIYLHISSLGGDLFQGFRAIDIIKNSKLDIYTVVEGYAVSAASLLYLAGKKRYMMKNSYLLIHQLSNYSSGESKKTYEEEKDNIQNDDKLMNHLYDFYIEASKKTLTKKKIQEILKHDLYWDYKTCKKYNLVDEIYNN